MKHNFNLIPDQYDYNIANNRLIIHHDLNFIAIDIDLIKRIEDCFSTISIIVESDNVCIWYSFYKKVKLVHASVIKL